MYLGTLFALIGGLMWGLVFVVPTVLSDYPAAMLSFGRYLAFGLVALPLAWLDRRRIAQFTRAEWIEVTKLSIVGNLVHYLVLAAAIQQAGSPLPTMIVGALPVVIAISSNRRDRHRDGQLPWPKLLPSLALIAAGIACVNHVELDRLRADSTSELSDYITGAALSLMSLVSWTWYALRNADWLRGHSDRSPRSWATAQGLAILPPAVLGFLGVWLWNLDSAQAFVSPFGPRPVQFLGLMFAMALFSTWLGALCWNAANKRLPTALVSQLIVFETLAALAYAFWLRGHWPAPVTVVGGLMLVAGVGWALRVRPEPKQAADVQGA